MQMERMPVEDSDSPEEEAGGASGAEKRTIGPLSDYYEEGGPAYYPTDPKKFLERLEVPRDPNQEIDVEHERERIGEQLETLEGLVAKETERESALGSVREELGIGASSSETRKKLEEAKEMLQDKEEELDAAEKFNDVLESFSSLSKEDLEHIKRTGKTKEGKAIRTKKGEEVHTDVAKHLATLAAGGTRRITWGTLRTLSQIVDALLHDVVGAVKGVFGLDKREAA